jgi:hypothetical protein
MPTIGVAIDGPLVVIGGALVAIGGALVGLLVAMGLKKGVNV